MNWVLLVRLLRPEVSRVLGGATFGLKTLPQCLFSGGSCFHRFFDPSKDPQKRVHLSLQEIPLFPGVIFGPFYRWSVLDPENLRPTVEFGPLTYTTGNPQKPVFVHTLVRSFLMFFMGGGGADIPPGGVAKPPGSGPDPRFI